MPRRSTGEYPANWVEIATEIKEKAGWKCVRCDHPHDPRIGRCLTVHHLDLDKSNCRWWNLPALCQRCHLSIQARVTMDRQWLFEHTDWFKPYVAGYYAYTLLDEDLSREEVEERLDELLTIGQPWGPSSSSGASVDWRTVDNVIRQIYLELKRQGDKWGQQEHDPYYWLAILMEEAGEAAQAAVEFDLVQYRKELLQVAAVAISMIDSLDRQQGENEQYEK